MKKEDFFEVLGDLDDDIVNGAGALVRTNTNGKIRTHSWLKWGAMAACLAVVLAVGAPYISGVFDPKGGLWQDSPLQPLNIIEYNGAYYEVIDMTHTKTLDTYNLPHEITADMVGSPLGAGLDLEGKQTKQILYQYTPYADIVTVTAEPKQERAQRAVYVVKDGGSYSFALFCNFISADSNSHTEASELFAVYGVDEAEDIANIMMGRDKVSDFPRIQEIFDNLYHSNAMGNGDYQDAIFNGMSEEDQQALSTDLADSAVEIKITTTQGVVINHLRYYPTINYVAWAINYYQLNNPI